MASSGSKLGSMPPNSAKPPPPPPPPPVYREIPDTTSKEARSVIDGLNARFAAAHPSSDLNVAGVIMRAFDDLSNPGREWEPCVKCKSPNRFPTSLAFPGHTDIYSNGPGGWIIRPIGVGILCSCYADCGSQGWGAQTVGCAGRACDPSYGVKQFGCNWKGPETLKEMMEQQVVVRAGGGYNEVVLDPGQWAKHLPRTVEAMFVLPRSRPADVQKVRRVHAEFCKAYGLKGEKAPPIVVYDPSGQTLAPFRPFSSGEGCDADCEAGKGRRELGNGGWHAAHDSAAQKEADAPVRLLPSVPLQPLRKVRGTRGGAVQGGVLIKIPGITQPITSEACARAPTAGRGQPKLRFLARLSPTA